ncbi:MAG: NAD-dependent epimerase/dehydratase family protein [Gemmatimonadales bacterium]
MKVLVTGADGFVGGWLIRGLLAAGHLVDAGIRPGAPRPAHLTEDEQRAVRWVTLELEDSQSVRAFLAPADAVIHLAAVASGLEAREDPGQAWSINAGGTARLLDLLARRRQESGGDPLVLAVSTGEVYGGGSGRPLRETDPLLPGSPYAASKVGAEVAGLETFRRTGLRVVIARPFPHTGPGQSDRYVVPGFLARLRAAKRAGAQAVKTGNLEPVRDFLDVRDVVAAYLALLERGEPGEVYNIASGQGTTLRDLFHRAAATVGVKVIPESDAALIRTADIQYLVGDASKLRTATGWAPRLSLDQTLRDIANAQAD